MIQIPSLCGCFLLVYPILNYFSLRGRDKPILMDHYFLQRHISLAIILQTGYWLPISYIMNWSHFNRQFFHSPRFPFSSYPTAFSNAIIPSCTLVGGYHGCRVLVWSFFCSSSGLYSRREELGSHDPRSMRRFKTPWNFQSRAMGCHRSRHSPFALPMISRLNKPRTRGIALIGLFLLGGL